MKYLILIYCLLIGGEIYWLLAKGLELKFQIEEGGDAVSFSYGVISDIMYFLGANTVLMVILFWKYYRNSKK